MRAVAKKPVYLFFLIPLALLCIVGVFFLNDVVISVRMQELRSFLQRINREAARVDNLGMISKYKRHKELYENKINEAELDKAELETALLLASFRNELEQESDLHPFLSGSVIQVINIFRFFLRKAPLQNMEEDPINDFLTVAYYQERNKKYGEALENYDRILQHEALREDQKPNILLHQGFCLSIMNRYEEAKQKYLYIMTNYNNEDIALVAYRLYEYQEFIRIEVDKIKGSSQNVLEKSENLYKLIAYNEAIEILDDISDHVPEDQEKIKFLKARCLEETGEQQESAMLYQEIIQENPSSDIARSSNRRILVMSAVDEKAEKLKELSKKNNEIIQDDAFTALLVTADKIETPLLDLSLAREVPAAESGAAGSEAQAAAAAAAAAAEAEAERTSKEAFDAFLETSLKVADEKIAVLKPVPVATEPPTPKATQTPSSSPTRRPTPRPTPRPTATLRLTPSPTPRPSATPSPTPQPTATPLPTASPLPTGAFSVEIRDQQNRVIRVDDYNSKGKLENSYSYVLDKEGNIIGIVKTTPQPESTPAAAGVERVE